LINRPLKTTRVSDFGDIRTYFLAQDIELIHTVLPPGTLQDRHGHAVVTELHYVVSGTVVIHDQGTQTFSAGDAFAFPPDGSTHLIENSGSTPAVMLTVKFISPGDATARFLADKLDASGAPAPAAARSEARPLLGTGSK
jgi:uncharacterized cupin superfamily protein